MSSGAAVGSARGRARLRSSCPSVCLAAARSRHGRFKELLVMQPTQHRFGEHECTRRQSMPGFWPRDSPTLGRRVRHARAERSMRTPTVVVSHPRLQDRTQMCLGHRDHPVQALPAEGADHMLADRVRLGTCERRSQDLRNNRQPARCQRSNVAGCSTRRAPRQSSSIADTAKLTRAAAFTGCGRTPRSMNIVS